MAKTGVLLINLGSPSSLTTSAIRSYLKEFLNDPRVIDINPIGRKALVHLIILPFRPRKTIKSYAKIWTKDGSPLIINTKSIKDKLAQTLGSAYQVDFAMRYGEPNLPDALERFKDCDKLIIVPLYPHYATSSTGSTLAKVSEIFAKKWDVPNFKSVHSFYNHPGFIEPTAVKIENEASSFAWDHILFSYHGIPERHIEKSACTYIKGPCKSKPCPENIEKPQFCYRYQCYQTSKLVAEKLNLKESEFSTSFQSRLGRTPWIKPYTDLYVEELHKKGVRNLMVTCPSFTADCLETTDEIGNELREQWLAYQGTSFKFVSCLNADTAWVEGLKNIVLEHQI
ncbi:MAG: ferrochelatase [Oligoflexales bacterium]